MRLEIKLILKALQPMARRAAYQVVEFPNHVVWHVKTEEKEGKLRGDRAQIEAKEAKGRERAQAQKKTSV